MSRVSRVYFDRMLTLTTVRFWREAVLTLGAVVGVVCIVLAIAGIGFGVKPLIVRSGSMSPTITTGALAFSHEVSAKDLRIGDVVSVPYGNSRVTHRIVAIAHDGSHATLTLRGDANPAADSNPYGVNGADRVLFHVPKLGYVVAWLAGPIGVFLGGLLCGLLLFIAFWTKKRDGSQNVHGGRRKKVSAHRVTVALLLVGLVGAGSLGIGGADPTWARFTDTAAVSTGGFSAGYLRPPTQFACHNRFLSTAYVDWSAPTTGPTPSGYLITYLGSGIGATSGTAGPQTSTKWVPPAGLLTVGAKYAITVQSVAFSKWKSAPTSSKSITVTLGLLSTCS